MARFADSNCFAKAIHGLRPTNLVLSLNFGSTAEESLASWKSSQQSRFFLSYFFAGLVSCKRCVNTDFSPPGLNSISYGYKHKSGFPEKGNQAALESTLFIAAI